MFTPNSLSTLVSLLAADSTQVYLEQPVNTSIFAFFGCRPLIPHTFPPGNFRLLYSSHLGVTCHPSNRCAAAPSFAGCAIAGPKKGHRSNR